MAATIVIEIDDAGAATVTVDGGEPQSYETPQEALGAVEALLEPAEAEEPEEMDAAAMWNEEAAKRAPQASLMA
jgi:hypothetical protein